MFNTRSNEANRLGLELCVHNCAGWSSSGGPWNSPEHSMQVVMTETQVTGRRNSPKSCRSRGRSGLLS